MDLDFLYNRYVRNRRVVDGYKYQFEPFGGGAMNESYFNDVILKEGDLFIDIGANAGGWTIPASKYYRRVIAFEANPTVARVLHKNVRINDCKNVWVMPFALGEEEKDKLLWQYSRNGQDSFLRQHAGLKDIGQGTKVKMVTLDYYKYSPTVIKIDTEGYELNVLKGASQTIQKHHPTLAIETHDPRDAVLIEKMLESYMFKKFTRPESQFDAEDQIIMIGEPQTPSV